MSGRARGPGRRRERLNPPEERPGFLKRARRLLIEQNASPGRLALAVGIGVFVGLSPFYMLHALIAGSRPR